MKLSSFALADVGCSKVALVVPHLSRGTNSERPCTARCCIVEPVEEKNPSRSNEIARAEALRRARHRAEVMLRLRLRKVFLLANEPSLEIQASLDGGDERDGRRTGERLAHEHPDPDPNPDPDANKKLDSNDNREMIVVGAVATDRNKRPLSFYAMRKQHWQMYERLASFAGFSIMGFVFPAVALGQSLLVHRRAIVAEATQARRGTAGKGELAKNKQTFIILDIGSRTTGIAVFAAGVPYACLSWEFGAMSIVSALAEAFALSPARAANLRDGLVLSSSFLDSLLPPSSHAGLSGLVERRFPHKDAASHKTATSQQGAARVVASAYASLFAEVARWLQRYAPQQAIGDAPIYITGGGSLIAGSHVLASHLLTRDVLPYPCLETKVFSGGERIATESVLACLSLLSHRGVGMPVPSTLSSLSPWSRRWKIFSSRDERRDALPSQPEETTHA